MRICHQRSMTSLFEVQGVQKKQSFHGKWAERRIDDGDVKKWKKENIGKYQLVLPSTHPDIERESALITQSENEREPRMIYFSALFIPLEIRMLSKEKGVSASWV